MSCREMTYADRQWHLPGLPEALVPGHPLTARNLTRGTHLTLGHGLSAREIAVLRAGGSLPFVTGRAFGAGRP